MIWKDTFVLCNGARHGLAHRQRIDTHNKHDNNQVVMSIMHILGDVSCKQENMLLLKICIKVDNHRIENKNQYMFALCITLVTSKYFAEVYLRFYINGHTHDENDQKFSMTSSALNLET